MKLETLALITKGWCLTTGAIAAAIAVGIVQIDMRELFGMDVKMWSLFLGSYSVGCNAMLAFLSQSFGDYKAAIKNGGEPPKVP
jgi:hypothetical protein